MISEIFQSIWYYCHQYWIDISDPRSKDWFMIGGGIWKILVVIGSYWLLVKRILPWYMRDKKPYDLKNIILIYNTIMVILNSAFFIILLFNIDYGRIFLNFNYPNRNDRSPVVLNQLWYSWWGYMSRFLDFFDTIFFVLRKKQNQVSFLHVYHHMIVPFLGWFSFKLNPLVPIIALFALFNTIIHVLMYSYYSLSALGQWTRPYLWWKRYITQLQLLQFAVCGIYGIILYFNQKDYPMIWFIVAVGQNPIFFYMFYDFYRNAYENNKNSKSNNNDDDIQQQQQNGGKSKFDTNNSRIKAD